MPIEVFYDHHRVYCAVCGATHQLKTEANPANPGAALEAAKHEARLNLFDDSTGRWLCHDDLIAATWRTMTPENIEG